MRSFWSDPYLWIHLAGLATLPIWLELCLLGLAVGDPILPTWLELFLVGGIGVAPILWMQWQRPFDIYSLLAVSLKPERLTEDERKLLTLFTARRNQFLAVGVAIVLVLVLQKLYFLAPIAASVTPFAASGRLIGLLVAAIAFLGANLFTQVPVAVLSVLLTSESSFAATLPFAVDQIPQRFTLLGLPVNQILPPIVADPPPQPVTVPKGEVESGGRVTSSPSEATAPAIAVPLNSDDLEDIWDAVEGETVSDLADSVLVVPGEADAELPVEKPDLSAVEVKTEEVKTEEDMAQETAQLESEPIPTLEEGWLDAPETDDPASAEPPNS